MLSTFPESGHLHLVSRAFGQNEEGECLNINHPKLACRETLLMEAEQWGRHEIARVKEEKIAERQPLPV